MWRYRDTEAWILAVLAKRAHRMFEFGTCTGRTAYLWARNAPPDSKVFTLTLPPWGLDDYRAEQGDAARALKAATDESQFASFVYTGTPEEKKIVQLYSDSKSFDESPYHGSCDLIFIDGSHAYSYVKNDTEKALRMVKPGGLVLWHDYQSPHKRATRGVFRHLKELSGRLKLRHIKGTSLVVYRHSPAQRSRGV